MQRTLKVIAILIGILVLVGVAISFLVPQEKLIAAAMPEIDKMKITNATIGEQEATMLVNVGMKSGVIPVFIDSLQYEMRLYDQTVSKGHKKLTEGSKRGKVQTLDLPVTMNHNQTRELVRRQVAEDEPVQVILKAYCDIPVLGKRTLDIDRKVDMVVPALPGMEVKDMKITDFGLDNMGMIMTMAIDNPNEFDFYVRKMDYDLVLKDFIVAHGSLAEEKLIKARSITPIQLTSNSDTKKPVKNAFKLLAGKSDFPYKLTSNMVIEPRSEVVGNINISSVKTGSIDVVEQLKNVKETKKAKNEAEQDQEKEVQK
ncbi:LEA type 2 family protein [Adhaeribacter aquaticus]|uniref:NDR1/HIN1-like protein n=1 Tax=Adhaeribacter aquaticus TaxID=299567 RepID=UPI0004010979|nr:LEA type 2 family protein [Adhaeribacter aquaticus]